MKKKKKNRYADTLLKRIWSVFRFMDLEVVRKEKKPWSFVTVFIYKKVCEERKFDLLKRFISWKL